MHQPEDIHNQQFEEIHQMVVIVMNFIEGEVDPLIEYPLMIEEGPLIEMTP